MARSNSDADSEKQRTRTHKKSSSSASPAPPEPAASRGLITCLRVTQIVFVIGVFVALGVSWYVRSYGSVFNSHENKGGVGAGGLGGVGGMGGGFGGGGFGGGPGGFGGGGFGGPGLFKRQFGGGIGGPGLGGHMGGLGGGGGFGLLGLGYGGEDGLGFSEYGMAFGFYEYPFSSIAYMFAAVVAGISFLVSVASFGLGTPLALAQVGLDALMVILWIVASSMLSTGTSICMPEDRDRMFIAYQIQEMLATLPWNFAAQFEFNINVYCGGVFSSIVLGMCCYSTNP
jgi:hypothetical protein